jgi:hypothetical protein
MKWRARSVPAYLVEADAINGLEGQKRLLVEDGPRRLGELGQVSRELKLHGGLLFDVVQHVFGIFGPGLDAGQGKIDAEVILEENGVDLVIGEYLGVADAQSLAVVIA